MKQKPFFNYLFVPKYLRYNKNVISSEENINYKEKFYVDRHEDVYDFFKNEKDKYNAGKKSIILLENKGRIFRPCPGTHNLRCCNYTIINTGVNCPYDCQYCFLQFYLNFYVNILFVDVIEKLQEKENSFSNLKNYIRVGTGEFTDSLVFDNIIPYSLKLMNFFSKYDKVVLELKTKSDNIQNLFNTNHIGNTVVSYSLNPEKIISVIEKGTANLETRLNNLKFLVDFGYKIAFHLDPIINYNECMDDYYELLEKIFALNISEKNIVWISLGTFRYNSKLKPVVSERFTNTKLFTEEFVQCADEKWRYFQPIRIKLYNNIINKIRQKYKKVFIYLCMESPVVWKNTLGWFPHSDDMLAKSFF